MKIEELLDELNLVYYGYDEDNNAIVSKIDTNEALAEFAKIIEALDKNKIAHTVENMTYIQLD
jgi:hypothetical protein